MDDDLKGLFVAMREENAAAHQATRNDFHRTADRLAEETGQHFEFFAERLEKRIDLLAESVQTLNEMVHRRVGAVELAVTNSAAETQAMIKFSHDELHRRVSALEETQRTTDQILADVRARLERLEASIH